ncbi:MAG: hypothetical protein P4L40_14170, partial [Terracidiphilus sp.]|nr:hypothetical protein [Terracidiphilus sp.]
DASRRRLRSPLLRAAACRAVAAAVLVLLVRAARSADAAHDVVEVGCVSLRVSPRVAVERCGEVRFQPRSLSLSLSPSLTQSFSL